MTQEDKQLLLKDLCTRLPYGVKGKCEIDASYDTSFGTVFQTHKFDAVVCGLKEDLLFVNPLIENKDEQEFANEEVTVGASILDFNPYLFPMSSMTDEEIKEYKHLVAFSGSPTGSANFIDWLNKNHFDYRGLIPMGLAIDATGLHIY